MQPNSRPSRHPAKRLTQLFGGLHLTWRFIIIFAVAIGIGVGIIARIPLLTDTSFSDIAVVLDIWIIIAIFIIVNCKTCKEAILKTFVFFLISQPLIYLTEVAIDSAFFGADFLPHLSMYFDNYYFGGGKWFLWTLLTIPGAAIAFEIKKDNLLASLVLSVATGYLAFAGGYGLLSSTFRTFPNHLLNSLICLAAAFSLSFLILHKKLPRTINLLANVLFAIVGAVAFCMVNLVTIPRERIIDYSDDTTISEVITADDSLVKVEILDAGRKLKFVATDIYGTGEIELQDSTGATHVYFVESTRDGIFVSEL